MRIILFYDLPVQSAEDTKNYTKFHKYIISRGFIMMQYSIYAKIISVATKYQSELNLLATKLPPAGNIRTLLITESQYQKMVLLRGELLLNEKINQKERYLKL